MKLSIITATYNAADTIAASLASVARQTHPDIEHWVIDGGSHDNTQAIVQASGARLAGFLSEPDNGIYDALNKGLRRATGEVVGFLHADDIYASDEVLATIASAFTDPAVDAVYGDLTYVERSDVSRVVRYWRAGEYDRSRLSRGWMPPHPTFYVRRSVYERFGQFDTSFRISADYECVLRFLFAHRIRARYIPQVLVFMRVGGISNRSLRNVLRKSAEDLRIMRLYGLVGWRVLLLKNIAKLSQFWARPV